MKINTARVRKCLKDFDCEPLFVEELGWNRYPNKPIELEIDSCLFVLHHVAELGGMVVFRCEDPETGKIPPKSTRLKIENKVKGIVHEHIIIFTDKSKTESLWLWVKREAKKASVPREHKFHRDQPGDLLLQKLAGIAFSLDDLDDQGQIDIASVKSPVAKAFDVDRVTKKFYNEFKFEHAAFLKFIKGIDSLDDSQWYASVMLNRLMFIYFIQKKGFLNSDPHYLSNKFKSVREKKKDTFYREFLVRLFFEGFALEPKERTPETKSLLGTIPFLNGGLFMPHQIEENYREKIHIADSAFDKLFQFFERYTWHLDDRQLRADNEINPDVLGYIFEKYINQKQMGAYYTKEDITDYICKNTIIPFLFDRHANLRYSDMNPFPMKDVEPYIYEAVKLGVELSLPENIASGIKDVSKRTDWNRPADPDYSLPTEIWRETVARRQRFQQIRDDFAEGKIQNINDLITYNLDIKKFAYDWARGITDPITLRAFYFENLTKITVLDPTCGSGAFLFAALNILETLYEICLDKMALFSKDSKYKEFKIEMERVGRHPNKKYFIYKSIIINNLFGVDLMEEAVEICKLRLFLKLVAQVDDVNRIEPLPDIDFNIKAGNTLVGYASFEEIERKKKGPLKIVFSFGEEEDIITKVKSADRELINFRKLQTELDVRSAQFRKAKETIKAKLKEIRDELDKDLATDYGIKLSSEKSFAKWRASHQPFHWYVEFYDIMNRGGFDVLVGNPPWIEYSKVKKDYSVRNYKTESCGNLYSICTERGLQIRIPHGRMSFIVQLPIVSSSRMTVVRNMLKEHSSSLYVIPFGDRPGKLFEGLEHSRATIWMSGGEQRKIQDKLHLSTTRYQRWPSKVRPQLFQSIEYALIDNDVLYRDVFPKYANTQIARIFKKVIDSSNHPLGEFTAQEQTQHFIFYQEATEYWVKATIGLPYYSKNGKISAPAHGRYLFLNDADTARRICAVMHSCLFFAHFVAYSDCFHLNDSSVRSFPIPKSLVHEDRLVQLGDKLMVALLKGTERKNIQTQDGHKIAYDEYYGWKAKELINEIDHVLSKHYGFTDEELDFIINYDIKYRMGKDSDTNDNEITKA
ncbi:MAG: hypothetical protein BWY28_01213 [bacterium ADurb.Bin236]|nr:MAG: hypothetical protein BWY28_01213 [bacterium ADurb.Bin236]